MRQLRDPFAHLKPGSPRDTASMARALAADMGCGPLRRQFFPRQTRCEYETPPRRRRWLKIVLRIGLVAGAVALLTTIFK